MGALPKRNAVLLLLAGMLSSPLSFADGNDVCQGGFIPGKVCPVSGETSAAQGCDAGFTMTNGKCEPVKNGRLLGDVTCPSGQTYNPNLKFCEGQRAGENQTTVSAPTPIASAPPPSSGEVAKSAAETVKTMTGTKEDSQNAVQANHQRMTTNGGASSRDTGTMDILEAILILPFNPGRAAKLLLSGQQAHEAAHQLDAVSDKAKQNAGLMTGIPGTASGGTGHATDQGSGSGSSGESAGSAAASGASGPMSSARAGELFGQLDTKYGMGRDDFVNGVNSVKGDPEGVGVFMQEATGDHAIGKDAIGGAMDAFAAEQGMSRGDLLAKYFPVSEPGGGATSGSATAQGMPTAPKPDSSMLGGTGEPLSRAVASAKAAKEASLRDKIRKALAERQARNSPSEELAKETLQPIRDAFFEAAKREQEKELSLFDVVRSKYAEKWQMMQRR
jgi:hypothetical protein